MVVLTDSDPSSPTKSQQAWPSQPGPSQPGSEAPRPQYGAVPHSPEVPYVPPPAYAPDANAPLLPGPHPKAPRRSAAKRFCGAFSIAVLIFIIISILKEIISGGLDFGPISWDNSPRPEDGNVVSCLDAWTEGNVSQFTAGADDVFNQTTIPGYPVFSSSKSYNFPIDSPLHYIIARGTLSSGAVIILGSEGADREHIGVQVVASYHSHRALSRVKLCELKKREGGIGLGIYTPSSRIDFGSHNEDEVHFTVTITLPISSQEVLNLNGFATKMQNFRHKIEGLGDRVHFDHLSLKGSNGAIEAEKLFVSQGTISTSNGKIVGGFNATDSLVLKTSNGAIDADIGITNDDTHRASNLVLDTSNARISSRVSLLTTHDQRPQPKGGHFEVSATTSNGRLDVKFPTSPVDSLLNFSGITSNGNVDVSLHAAYEGKFTLGTSSSGSVEIDKENARDPSGKGRYRTVTTTRASRKLIEGSIFWGNERDHDRNAEMGHAVITTSNSWARLRLI